MTSTVTGRYWAKRDFHSPPIVIELRDGATGVDIRAPWDHDSYVLVRKYGTLTGAICCCGPAGSHPMRPEDDFYYDDQAKCTCAPRAYRGIKAPRRCPVHKVVWP